MNRFQFRNDPNLVSQWADELKTNGLLKLVLEVMENDHPARLAIQGDANDDISPTRAQIELGTTRGYSMYDGRFKQLSVSLTPKEQASLPESEYKPETSEEIEPVKRGRGRPRKT